MANEDIEKKDKVDRNAEKKKIKEKEGAYKGYFEAIAEENNESFGSEPEQNEEPPLKKITKEYQELSK